MAEKNERPIIIVKRKKKGGGGHHGGAWKVAYADFVTAMMAFFMVMWLVTAVSKEKRAAIFEYFKNPSMESGKSVKPAPGQMGPGGASTSPINLGGGLDAMRTASNRKPDVGANPNLPVREQILDREFDKSSDHKRDTEEEAREQVKEAEHKKLETLMEELKEAVSKSQALQPFKDQLLLDITPEGIRIQIVDAQNRPMFDVGSARLRDYTQSILHELTPYLSSVPNRISITGHTDIRPYPGQGYSNWELSADRANAARRSLVTAGLPDEKIARVVGLSSSVLFDKQDPQSPINRRISIVIMTKQAEEDALKTDVANATPVGGAPVSNTGAAPSPGATGPAPEPVPAASVPTANTNPAASNPTPAVNPAAAPALAATIPTVAAPQPAAPASVASPSARAPIPVVAAVPAASAPKVANSDAINAATAALSLRPSARPTR